MKKEYSARSDLEKLHSQWTKLTGFHRREEWSAAVVRAATAAEIATNIAIRSELKAQANLQTSFVDALLKWANGIDGKFGRLLVPLIAHDKRKKAKLASLKKLVIVVNDKRNAIVHRGEFCNQSEAEAIIDLAKRVIEGLMELYDPVFVLADPKSTGKSSE